MADEFIAIAIDDLAAVQKLLANLPPVAQDAAIDAGNLYYINQFRTYPSYRYVERKRAYPDAKYKPGWFSAKQLRYVAWQIRLGNIKLKVPNRTQRLRKGWRTIGSGRGSFLANDVPYAKFLQAKATQARQPMRAGWDVVEDITADPDRRKVVARRMVAAIDKALRKLAKK